MDTNQTDSRRLVIVRSLDEAHSDYAGRWRGVDELLYQSFRERGHADFPDVYTKVVLVNRVYAAGISRSSRSLGDREAKVAEGLVLIADGLEVRLASLAGRSFDLQLASEILQLHYYVAKNLLDWTGQRWLTSFVSKYLHFHCDQVPIFDERAVSAARRMIKAELVEAFDAETSALSGGDAAYRNFLRAFLPLYKAASSADGDASVSVKLVDHMLWRYVAGEQNSR